MTKVDDVLVRNGLGDIARLLPAFLMQQRWFGGRERDIVEVTVEDAGVLLERDPTLLFLACRVTYRDGGHEIYSVPVGMRPADHPMREAAANHVLAQAEVDGEMRVLYDALADNDCSWRLWQLMRGGESMPTVMATLRGSATEPAPPDAGPSLIRMVGGEQSNTSLALGTHELLKWVRRLDPGPSIEQEMFEALALGGFAHMPQLLGGVDYVRTGEPPTRVAFLQGYIANAVDGWQLAMTSLRDLYAGTEIAHARDAGARQLAVAVQGGTFVHEATRLGSVTADMHLALGSDRLADALAPIPLDRDTLNQWADSMTSELDQLLDSDNALLARLRPARAGLRQRFEAIRSLNSRGLATRIHGDYHLNQVIRTDLGWTALDFEGEPARPIVERRRLSSPLRDVAGMLRSFDYCAAAALAERMSPTDPRFEALAAQGDTWALANREAFWRAYCEGMAGGSLLPADGDALTLRRAFEVQKAVYEVRYELGHRPEWVGIPIRFLASMP